MAVRREWTRYEKQLIDNPIKHNHSNVNIYAGSVITWRGVNYILITCNHLPAVHFESGAGNVFPCLVECDSSAVCRRAKGQLDSVHFLSVNYTGRLVFSLILHVSLGVCRVFAGGKRSFYAVTSLSNSKSSTGMPHRSAESLPV